MFSRHCESQDNLRMLTLLRADICIYMIAENGQAVNRRIEQGGKWIGRRQEHYTAIDLRLEAAI